MIYQAWNGLVTALSWPRIGLVIGGACIGWALRGMVEAWRLRRIRKQDRQDVTETARWLRKLLARGPASAATVFAHGEMAGYTQDAVQEAARLVRVQTFRMRGHIHGPRYWRLPNKGAN